VRFPASPARFEGAIADWRAFSARDYRSFRVLAVAQGFIGALSGPAIVLPLLLELGAHPALATLLAMLPVVGTVAQRWVPSLLDRTDGNMRGIVLLAITVGEPRGLYMALLVGLTGLGILPAWAAIAGIAVLWGVLGATGAIAYGMLQAWYQIVLPDDRRRVVTPRLGGIALGIGSVILLPFALWIDDLVAVIGLSAYAIPFAIGGSAGLIAAVGVRHLPRPGRVRVPRTNTWREGADAGRLRNHGRLMSMALLAAGLSPFLSLYAIVVLGTGAGFAIAVSAASSGTLVLASLFVSSRLARGSSSRTLRASFALRAGALFLGLAAHPANPFAPIVILVVAVILAAGDAAGALSANERLVRLATGPSVIAFQSHYVLPNVLAYALGIGLSSGVMLIGGWASFAILFGAAGLTRLAAARATQVSTAGTPVDTAASAGA
jgi:hypothetical protein